LVGWLVGWLVDALYRVALLIDIAAVGFDLHLWMCHAV
jgi:hypothetical protein